MIYGTDESFENLVTALTQQGVKFTSGQIVAIGRMPNGKIVFLENGTVFAGWCHILAKQSNFVLRGISTEQIVEFIMTALTQGEIVDQQGQGNLPRPIFKVTFEGKTYYVAITIGNNGFIVRANPISSKFKE